MSQLGVRGNTAHAEVLAAGWPDKEETFRPRVVGVKGTPHSNKNHRYKGHRGR